jgi:ferredoxin
MKKYRIIYDREACIGAFACSAAAPDFWAFNEDGKADFKGATYNPKTKKWEMVVDSEQDYDDNQAAAESCPVFAIVIQKIEETPESDAKDPGDYGGTKSEVGDDIEKESGPTKTQMLGYEDE